jgi:lipopolysaccharide export system permease protein
VWFKNKEYFSSFKSFNANTKELNELTLYLYDKNILTKIIQASKAIFVKETSWILKPLTVYDELNLKNFSLIKGKKQLLVDLFVSPDDFTNYEAEANTLNIHNLGEYIDKLDKTGINTNKFKVLYFEKYSLSLICIIFALFPLSTIYNPNRRSSSFGKNVVFTLVFTIAYWLMYSSTIVMGNSGKIHPALATLILPVFFIAYIIYIYTANKKL